MAAIAKLEPALRPLGIQPVLETQAIDDATFRAAPAESNRIWIGGKPMEEWLGASAGDSPCCEVCGDLPCRTMEVDGQTYEAIPEDLIVKAGIIAASRLLGPDAVAVRSSCCSTGCRLQLTRHGSTGPHSEHERQEEPPAVRHAVAASRPATLPVLHRQGRRRARPRWPAPAHFARRRRQACLAGQHGSGLEPRRDARQSSCRDTAHADAGRDRPRRHEHRPGGAAEDYRARVLAQLRAGHDADADDPTVREQLSGACTTEIAAFDEFVGPAGRRRAAATTTSSSTPPRPAIRCGC